MVVGLYFLPLFTGSEFTNNNLIVDTAGAILSGVTFVVAFGAYWWTPQKYGHLASAFVYLLLVLTTATLVLSTGETGSPFIALWIAVAVFAGIFGVPGLAILLFTVIAYLAYAFLTHATPSAMIIGSIAGIGPLIASFIIWHTKTEKDDTKDKAYKDLASELSQVANKSDVVINAIDDGVIAVDKKGVIQLINPAAQRIIGWGKDDAVGLSYKSVVKLHDHTDTQVTVSNDPVEKVLASNQEIRSDLFSVVTESGKKVLLSIVVSPIGQVGSGVIIVFRDITNAKREEREQAEFISTASHEMRTPVASIEGYLGLALNPATATIDEKARDYITKAQASAQHLGRLFQDLLDVTKADDGRIGNSPTVINVVEYLDGVLEGLKPKADEKDLRFIYKPRPADNTVIGRMLPPVFYVNVDKDHLREVIANLVENAIKYTPAGDVVIDVTGTDADVIISVADSGIGIPAEDISHLFQKFYRVDNSDTREIGGTGLGLYLCRRLTEVMGGRITVKSEYKKGSTFEVILPRIDNEEATRLIEQAAEKAEKEAQKPAILPIGSTSTMATEAPNTATQPQTTSSAGAVSELMPAPSPAPVPAPAPVVPQPKPTMPHPISTPNPAPTAPIVSPYASGRPSVVVPKRNENKVNQP